MTSIKTPFTSKVGWGGTGYVVAEKYKSDIYTAVQVPRKSFIYCSLTLQVYKDNKWKSFETKIGFSRDNNNLQVKWSVEHKSENLLSRIHVVLKDGNKGSSGKVLNEFYTYEW